MVDADRTPTAEHWIAPDGTPIEYYDIGEGPVILSPHGYGGDAASQLPWLQPLADEFRVITYSQRGWGGTPLAGEISLAQSARDAKGLLEHLGVGSACFVGLSMGGAVIWAYAEQFGTASMRSAVIADMTPKLVCEDGWEHGLYQGWYTRERYEADVELQQRDLPGFAGFFFEQALLQHTPDEPRTFTFDEARRPDFDPVLRAMGLPDGVPVDVLFQVDAAKVPTWQRYWRAMGDIDQRPALGRLAVPLTLAYARPGSIYTPETGEYVRDASPDARLVVFEDATHVSFVLEAAPRFIEEIRRAARP